MRELIRTNYRHTISMGLDVGDLFADANTTLDVVNIKNGRTIGHINSDYFLENRYIRTTAEGNPVYVCPFVKKVRSDNSYIENLFDAEI